MNNNFLIPFIVSFIAGLSTLIGCFFIYIKPKNINCFIGISLSFSAMIMILISLFELIPEGFFYFENKYGIFNSIIILIIMLFVGYIINILINKSINKSSIESSNLYRVGVLSMIALIIHNLPEGIITFLTSSVNIELGLKLGIAIMMHNIPEGIAIAVPLYYSLGSRKKSFISVFLSGLSEPFGALIAYLFLYKFISDTMISFILLFVAGIMISISINDIFEEAHKYCGKYTFIGIFLAFFLFFITEIIF